MESLAHILVVDDHREIRDLLAKYLAKNGFRVSAAESAAKARRLLEASGVDLVVLDIMMPGEDGLALCRQLRANTQLPMIMLTAMAEDTDRVIGLEMGADDYVIKAVQSARAGGAHQGGAAARQQPAAAARAARGRAGCASTAGPWMRRSAS